MGHGGHPMTELWSEAFNWLQRMWLVICLSLLGGMARAAKCGERTFGGWFCSALVALFSGVVTHMLMQDITSISDTVRVACASVSAYSGGVLLDAVQARIADVVLTGINKRG